MRRLTKTLLALTTTFVIGFINIMTVTPSEPAQPSAEPAAEKHLTPSEIRELTDRLSKYISTQADSYSLVGYKTGDTASADSVTTDDMTSSTDMSETDSSSNDSDADSKNDSSDIDDSSTVDDNSSVTEDIEEIPAVEEPQYIWEPDDTEYEYYDQWLWVGDSRIVGMSAYVGIEYLAKSAMGLNWYLENQDIVYEKRGYNVVFCLGVNDYGNVYNYADVYNNMPEEFIENNKIFILSVNPVEEEKGRYYGYYVWNSNYEWFNENLRINLRDDFYWLDSYTYLRATGYNTVDGVHYDGNTYVKIYNFVVGTVTGQEFW